MDKGAWWAAVHGVAKSQTQLSNEHIAYASLVAQTVKRLPAMQETWVRSLGGEDPPKEGMATHSSILARRIPRTEEPGTLQSVGSQRVRYDLATKQQQSHTLEKITKW